MKYNICNMKYNICNMKYNICNMKYNICNMKYITLIYDQKNGSNDPQMTRFKNTVQIDFKNRL